MLHFVTNSALQLLTCESGAPFFIAPYTIGRPTITFSGLSLMTKRMVVIEKGPIRVGSGAMFVFFNT